MKLSAFFCLCLMVMIVSAFNPVSAEIYQFTDENGETHYTNDSASIPKQYRDDLQISGETIIYGNDQNFSQPAPSTGSSQEASTEAVQPQGNLGKAEALKAKEVAFDNEFKKLQEERERLDKAMKNAETAEDREEVNDANTAFNMWYKDFNNRRNAFKEEVRAFNEQVRQDMEQKLNQYKARQSSMDDDL